MPITIENEEYEFDLLIHSGDAVKLEPEFELYLDVKDVLVIFPVKFEIEVGPQPEESVMPQQD